VIEVRPERATDHDTVRRMNVAAFGQPDEADLVDRLRAQARPYLGLVAEVEGAVVGHIAFSPVTLDPPRPGLVAFGLAPTAVLPEHQRRGAGAALVWEGLAACRRAGGSAVVVLGHPLYYPRFGFRPASTFGLRCEYDVPDEAFMALALVPGALDGASALARYHPAFVS
jgi:putative acetyltransferase